MRIIHKIEKILRAFTGTEVKHSFSLNELDLKLEKYIKKKRGFFIEAGANNGITQSNTYFFEKYKKWHGILVEPIPEKAQECARNRPHSAVYNCALVASSFRLKEISLNHCDLMSTIEGSLGSKQLEHLTKGKKLQNLKLRKITVPASTLTSILDEVAPKTIDLLSLDVEGYELNVLKGLDFNRYKPHYILVELLSTEARESISNYLSEHYIKLADLSHHDALFVLKSEYY